MLRELIKVDEFMLPRGRCIVVYSPQDVNKQNYIYLLDEVVFVHDGGVARGEYLVATDIRYVLLDAAPGGGIKIDSNGVPFLGMLVRPAGIMETVAYNVFE